MIPKIIWQTHEWEYEDLPYDFKMASLTWKNLNPDWQHKYVSKKDREKHIAEYDKNLLRFYNSCDGITQSDIWRYVVLYLHGGVYVDMDTLACGKLTEILPEFDKGKDFFCMPYFYIDGKKSVVTGAHAAPRNSHIANKLARDICLTKDEKALSDDFMFDQEEKLRFGWNLISDCILKYEDSIGFNFTDQVIRHWPSGQEFKYNPGIMVFFDFNWYSYEDLSSLHGWK
jgi:hypothetical protein